MSSRYAHAFAAPPAADACFAMDTASSEMCICLDDSRGSRDSQQDSAVKDFARHLLHSTTPAVRSSAVAL